MTSHKKAQTPGQVIGGIFLGFVALAFLIILFGSWFIIQPGQRGLVVRLGELKPGVYEEGLHFKAPVIDSVVKMNIQTQKHVAEKADAASHDLQTVTTDITINYHIQSDQVINIYRNIGRDYESVIIQPAVLEILKSSTAHFTAEELITKRTEVKEQIDNGLHERLEPYGIIVDAVSITDFQFSEVFHNAIEAKATAEQSALAAKNKLAQVEYERQQRITQAQGEAEAIKIQTEAIQRNGGAAYVQLQAIQRWNGALPLVTGGNSMPFLNLQPATSSSFTTVVNSTA